MKARRRWFFFIPVAAIAITAATCQPTKPPKVNPAPPGVNPCTENPVVINGDECDWLFQRDTSTSTVHEFTTEAASIGAGSVKAGPISANAADKFIAEYFAGVPVADLQSVAYDFQIAGDGVVGDAQQFYMNIYANFDDSDDFFPHCRFDVIPTTGSITDFTTVNFATTDNVPVTPRNSGGPLPTCPATLAEMPDGSHVRAIALNVGDTSASDEGLAGFLDNVKVTTTAGTTTFDFEDE